MPSKSVPVVAMYPIAIEITEESGDRKCCFCRRTEINSTEWGPMYKLNEIVAHYFCLLFSANMNQCGEDNEGILGFMPNDIKVELKRGSLLKCKYCKKTGATIGCDKGICRHAYHYPCGYANGCLFEFLGSYVSHCGNHKPKQTLPEGISKECALCFGDTGLEDWVLPPCCKTHLFHRSCIMKTAFAAGYFFKCPLCNSADVNFLEVMKKNGVYIPERDASWELEPNAFSELMIPLRCDVEKCLCRKGRDYTPRDYCLLWDIIRCEICGAVGTHMKCSNLSVRSWKCGCDTFDKPTSGANDEMEVDPESATVKSNTPASAEEEKLPQLPFASSIVNDHHMEESMTLPVNQETDDLRGPPACQVAISPSGFMMNMSSVKMNMKKKAETTKSQVNRRSTHRHNSRAKSGNSNSHYLMKLRSRGERAIPQEENSKAKIQQNISPQGPDVTPLDVRAARKPSHDKRTAMKPTNERGARMKTTTEKRLAMKPTNEKGAGMKPTTDKGAGIKPTTEKRVAMKPPNDKGGAMKPTNEKVPEPRRSLRVTCHPKTNYLPKRKP